MTTPINPGLHLLIDFWEVENLQNIKVIERAMYDAAMACGATVLEVKLHSFGESGGITGVAILAESHITIHTWPELSYVALDIFVCGSCNPHLALPILRHIFQPKEEKISQHQRGL